VHDNDEENRVRTSQNGAEEQEVIGELYREALRGGQPLWFRVSSGSMHPLLRIGEEVYIEPATAGELQVGEIAAFETDRGLVIHRIVQRHTDGDGNQLLEMSDTQLRASPIESGAVIGRVVAIGRGKLRIDLQRPIAQKCGHVTARIRYRFYTMRFRSRLMRVILRKSARLVARLAGWSIRRLCASSQPVTTTHPGSN
jgi:signal peptidase I